MSEFLNSKHVKNLFLCVVGGFILKFLIEGGTLGVVSDLLNSVMGSLPYFVQLAICILLFLGGFSLAGHIAAKIRERKDR